tara:strand:- start:6506 stop:7744 length:1239 start_codon:yes stop_codon:yes gene_type:complete
MVLPLLGSFLGSALLPSLAGTGITAALANPVVAGAFGSGIGSLLQGDSFEEALGTGLTSYFGGKLLGGLAKPVATSAQASSAALDAGLRKAPEGFMQLAENLGGDTTAGFATKLAVPTGTPTTLFDQGFTKEGLQSAGQNIMGALSQGAKTAMANPLAAAGTAGGAMFADASNQQGGVEPKTPFQPRETVPIQQNINTPFAGYRPGVDPEFNYGFRNPAAGELQTQFLNQGGMADYVNPTMLSKGGIATFAKGGDMPDMPEEQMGMPDVNEKDIIVNAVNALKGNIPEQQASIALAMFVNEYGEEALKDLVADVRDGEYDNIGGKADGQIKGGGDGMSDSIPATIDGKQDLLLSSKEYVVDSPTMSLIGNGDPDAGAEKLDNFRKEIRKKATGSPEQPKQIDAEKIMRTALS